MGHVQRYVTNLDLHGAAVRGVQIDLVRPVCANLQVERRVCIGFDSILHGFNA